VQLLEEDPASSSLRGRLATSWNNLGTVFRAQRKDGEAEHACEQSLIVLDAKEMKEIARGSPEDIRFQHLRAQAWNNLGTMRNAASRFADAEEAFREAIAIKEDLAATFPSIPQYREELANAFNNLGTAVSSLNRMEEARTAYESAIQIYERLIASFPADPRFAVMLAGTCANLGRLIGDEGQLEESLPWLNRGVEILEAAFKKDARIAKVRESLCIASWARAMTLAGLERYPEALMDWNRALEVDDGRHQTALLLRRAFHGAAGDPGVG
jgi:tetratricopeptide (TPR) repeat protein